MKLPKKCRKLHVIKELGDGLVNKPSFSNKLTNI